jgi:hypothetical protein
MSPGSTTATPIMYKNYSVLSLTVFDCTFRKDFF